MSQNPNPPSMPTAGGLSRRRALLLTVAAVLCLGLAGTIWQLTRAQSPVGPQSPPPPEGWQLAPLPAESPTAHAQAAIQAFTAAPPCADPAALHELVALFTGLDRQATGEGSPAGAVFDFERAYREALRYGGLDAAQIAQATGARQDLIARLQVDGPQDLAALAQVDRFEHTLIVELTALPPAAGETAAVIAWVQRFDPGGNSTKERWWLAKTATGWRLYDFENLYTGVRYTQYLACLLAARPADPSPVMALILLRSYLEHRQLPPTEAALQLERLHPGAQAAAADATTPAVGALAAYCRGLIRLQVGAAAEALEDCRAALKLQPGFAAAWYLQGECHNRLAQYEQALQAAAAIDGLLGRDPFAADLRATALLALDRSAELPAEFAVILDHRPCDAPALESLFRTTPAAQRGAVFRRYGEMIAAGNSGTQPRADGLLHHLAQQLIAENDADGLEQLLAARLAGRSGSLTGAVAGGLTPGLGAVAEAGDDLAVLYRVKVFQLRAQWPELQQYIAAALARVRDPELAELIRDSGWRAAVMQKQAVATYGAVVEKDKTAAFRVLAEALQAQGDIDGLAELILARHGEHPEDVWIHYYAGVRSLMQTDYPRAEAHFYEAVSQAKAGDPQALFASRWVSAAYAADHGIQAFDTASDKKAAFAQLKRYYLEDGRDELLEMLVERYRPKAGNDPEFALALADVQFLSQQYQPAIDQLEAARAQIEKGSPDQIFELYDCLLRCLIRQKQYPIAEKELQGVQDEKQAAFLSAMLAASEGKIDGTLVALRACQRAGFTPEIIYGDVDLGAALRTAAMQQGVGAEFPMPKGMAVLPPKPEVPPQAAVTPPGAGQAEPKKNE